MQILRFPQTSASPTKPSSIRPSRVNLVSQASAGRLLQTELTSLAARAQVVTYMDPGFRAVRHQSGRCTSCVRPGQITARRGQRQHRHRPSRSRDECRRGTYSAARRSHYITRACARLCCYHYFVSGAVWCIAFTSRRTSRDQYYVWVSRMMGDSVGHGNWRCAADG